MSQTLHDKIVAYLSDTMPPDERQSFEQTMVADPSVAEEVALYQLEREGHELLIEQELREKALAWMDDPASRAELKTEGAAAQGGQHKLLLWAAGSILILLLLFALYRSWQRNPAPVPPPAGYPERPAPPPAGNAPAPSAPAKPIAGQNEPNPAVKEEKPAPPEKRNPSQLLAAAYYEKPDFSGELRRSDEGGAPASPLSAAAAAWEKGDAPKMISLLQNIPSTNPYYLQAQEMLGHAYFTNKDYTKASAVFAAIRSNDAGKMAEKAAWYEALSWVAAGQTDRARPLLDNISKDAGHPYNKSAISLLQQFK